MTNKELKKLVEELKEQDEIISKMFQRREEIYEIVENADCYEKALDMLESDGKEHWDF